MSNNTNSRECKANPGGLQCPQESPEPLLLFINPNGEWQVASEAPRKLLKRLRASDLLREPQEM